MISTRKQAPQVKKTLGLPKSKAFFLNERVERLENESRE
jgi:hypothetical protein